MSGCLSWGDAVPETSSVVRIAVLAPGPVPNSDYSTLGALRRLGGEVEVDLVRSVAACMAVADSTDLDLIVVDEAPLADVICVLDRCRETGLPVIAVTGEDADSDALAAFRSGAADCIRAGIDVKETLPLVALDQIRKYRQQREREWLAKRISELQRYNENIIQNLNSALVVVDNEGVITYANPAAGAVLRGVEEAEAPSLEGVVEFAGAVGRQDHDRPFVGCDGSDLGNRDLEVGEQFEEEGLELVVGSIDLVDQENGVVAAADRLEEGPFEQEVFAVQPADRL